MQYTKSQHSLHLRLIFKAFHLHYASKMQLNKQHISNGIEYNFIVHQDTRQNNKKQKQTNRNFKSRVYSMPVKITEKIPKTKHKTLNITQNIMAQVFEFKMLIAHNKRQKLRWL